jgi:hypothetical protein
MTENITEKPVFATGIGWSKASADRPYFDDLTAANAENVNITVRIDPVPPPTNYKDE